MPGQFADLEDVINAWITQMWDLTKSKEEGKLPRDALSFQISFKKVKFNHGKNQC